MDVCARWHGGVSSAAHVGTEVGRPAFRIGLAAALTALLVPGGLCRAALRRPNATGAGARPRHLARHVRTRAELLPKHLPRWAIGEAQPSRQLPEPEFPCDEGPVSQPPQTSLDMAMISRIFAHCCSCVRMLPSSVDAKPHWGDSASCSSGA
jgi:hypothetical protein